MDSSHDSSSSDGRETSMNTSNDTDKKIYHRHSNHQIQRLEAYFKECPHPDESQRRKLGEELKLKPKQIKFWFQNKRTQAKTQNEKADNAALRTENMKIRCENEALQDALKTVTCPPCGGPLPGRQERELSLQKLRLENVYLKEQRDKIANFLTKNNGGGPAIASDDPVAYLQRPSPYASTSNNPRVSYGSFSSHLPEPPILEKGPYRYSTTGENIRNTQPPQPRKPLQLQHIQPLSPTEKLRMSDLAISAMAQVIGLIRMEEPMWTKSSIDGRLVIDQDQYQKSFPKISPYFKSPSARIESSKEVVVVPMDARNLVDMFLDTEKWARLFSTIVNEAKTIEALESMDPPRQSCSKLMYEQMHILSPLVSPREFVILRCCQQMEDDLWVIADVSYHHPNADSEFETPTCSKRPSGCLIRALPDGRSKVMWIEHVEVNERVRTHRLYRDLLCGGSGYGARRWIATLQRMCERLSLSSISVIPTTDYAGVVKTMEGRRGVMELGERMLKNFAWVLKMSEKFDFSQLSESNSSGIRIAVRLNTEAGQPSGLIVSAGSSLCLPLSPLQVYNFLRNVEVRHQWDVLCHGNPVSEVARFATGTDINKNCVTMLQPSSPTENGEMMIIQDGFIDALGGMVAYAPMDLNTAYGAISGVSNTSGIPILPSGFMISRDARPSAAAELDGNCTTILTVAFQILVSGPTSTSEDFNYMEESAATVNTLISSTIQRIKAMLNCHDGH